jgi:ATP-dependent Zn protease
LGSDRVPHEDYRFAVAVHEAGHAVVAAYLRFDVDHIEMKGMGGQAVSGPFVFADRVDYMAPWSAGNAAVEEVCAGYRLPVDANANSDHEKLRWIERELAATDEEKRLARSKARKIVRSQRLHIVTIAEALLASEGGRLEGEELERLLTPVWAANY